MIVSIKNRADFSHSSLFFFTNLLIHRLNIIQLMRFVDLSFLVLILTKHLTKRVYFIEMYRVMMIILKNVYHFSFLEFFFFDKSEEFVLHWGLH